MCETVLAFKDKRGNLHKSEKDCKLENIKHDLDKILYKLFYPNNFGMPYISFCHGMANLDSVITHLINHKKEIISVLSQE